MLRTVPTMAHGSPTISPRFRAIPMMPRIPEEKYVTPRVRAEAKNGIRSAHIPATASQATTLPTAALTAIKLRLGTTRIASVRPVT